MKQQPAEPPVEQRQQPEEQVADPYASWREWFRLHERDADILPLPQWTPPRMADLAESEVTVYDLVTGETRVGRLRDLFPQSFDEYGQFFPYMESNADEQTPLDAFSVGEIVEDPSISPWKVNCKLLISANGGVGHGSGILIDGQHVLTAGHCVYNIDLDEWVDMIEVIPAYDEGDRPFGTAYSSGFLAWTGWTVAHDWNWDLAVVKLNRPVGAITGWFPYDYNATNSFYLTNTFHSTGYPVTAPFNGTRLNYRYGPFDSASTNILYELDTTSYGGMSGGGVYYRSGLIPFTRTVHAVASHGWNGYGGFNRITIDKRSGIASYIYNNHSPLLDLAVLGCTAFPESLDTGEPLDSVFFYLYNLCADTFENADLTVRLYLSANDYITESDVLLSSTVFNDVDLWPGERRKLDWPTQPLMPWNQYGSWRWLGVMVMYADSIIGNNASSYDDADSVYISLAPPGQAGDPTPYDGQTNVGTGALLTWMNGPGATSHNVYFGETIPPQFRVNQTGLNYDPPGLWPGHVYYWRIDEVNPAGTTTGELWQFTTTFPDPPGAAADPDPANGAISVPRDVVCSWSAGAGFTEEFDVYFGTTNPPPFIHTQVLQSYDPPGELEFDRLYYWKIVSRNASGETGSALWHFTTIMQAPEAASDPIPANGATGVSIFSNLWWTQGARTNTEDLYFGTTNPPPYIGRNDYDGVYNPPGNLAELTTFYWQIREVNTGGQTMGPLWSFTTEDYTAPPGMPSNPSPADGAMDVSPHTSYSFTPGSGATYHELWFFDYDDYYLYWGGTETVVPYTAFGPLEPNTYYSWRIKEFNGPVSTMGPPWFFTTGGPEPTEPPLDLTIRIAMDAAHLRWRPAPNGYYYIVQYSSVPDFTTYQSFPATQDTFFTDQTVGPSPDFVRFYRVVAGQ